jgi:hypothetical protein
VAQNILIDSFFKGAAKQGFQAVERDGFTRFTNASYQFHFIFIIKKYTGMAVNE